MVWLVSFGTRVLINYFIVMNNIVSIFMAVVLDFGTEIEVLTTYELLVIMANTLY